MQIYILLQILHSKAIQCVENGSLNRVFSKQEEML